MNRETARQETFRVARHVRRMALDTARAYRDQVGQFVAYCQDQKPTGSNEEKVVAYLSSVAHRISAATQKQKLHALLFFFEHVLEKPLGELGPWRYARVAKRLPVWLTQSEMQRVLSLMDGMYGLMAHLTYGCGLRRSECLRLRVQHIDLESRVVRIVASKGNKDRNLALPESLVAPLAEHLQKVRALWEGDQANGLPPVAMPEGMQNKFAALGSQWGWFWVFPQGRISQDPESGIRRRHHAVSAVFSRSVSSAVKKAGIAKRVTLHVLRHSFATHLIERGVAITTIQKLMGHKHISTTEVYLHCLPKVLTDTRSPLDDLQAKVVEFPAAPPAQIAKNVS